MTEIYIPLLEEGSPVSRPTQGVQMGDGIFLVLPTENYEKSEEVWEFPPGSMVFCEKKEKQGRELLVARRLAKAPIGT